MATAKSKTRTQKIKVIYKSSNFVVFVIVLLLVAVGATTWLFIDMSNQLKTYRAANGIHNQACLGISDSLDSLGDVEFNKNLGAITVVADSGNTAYAKTGSDASIEFGCSSGQKIPTKLAKSSKVGTSQYISYVGYYRSAADAQKAVDKNIKPLHSWAYQELNKNNRSYSYVADGTLFDAYKVTGNAVVRLVLPCPRGNVVKLGCETVATTLIDNFAEGIEKINP